MIGLFIVVMISRIISRPRSTRNERGLSWFRWHNVYLFSFLFHAARDSEILRLKQLLDEKAEKSNSKSTGLVVRTPESILENSIPMSPKRKTPLSHGKVKRVQLSENAHHSSPAEEPQEVRLET